MELITKIWPSIDLWIRLQTNSSNKNTTNSPKLRTRTVHTSRQTPSPSPNGSSRTSAAPVWVPTIRWSLPKFLQRSRINEGIISGRGVTMWKVYRTNRWRREGICRQRKTDCWKEIKRHWKNVTFRGSKCYVSCIGNLRRTRRNRWIGGGNLINAWQSCWQPKLKKRLVMERFCRVKWTEKHRI